MNFFKRATISVKRRSGKTVILFLLVFILGNIMSGAIAISQAVQNTETNLRRNLPAVATLVPDRVAMNEYQTVMDHPPETEPLLPKYIRQVGELPQVRIFDFSVVTNLVSRDLERVWISETDEFDWQTLGLDWLEAFRLRGVNSPEMLDIQEGIIELVNGRVFTEEEMNHFNQINSVAIISQDLAQLNNLTIGSVFTLENIVSTMWFQDGDWARYYHEDYIFAMEAYEFEVVGIFDPLISPGSHLDEHEQNELRNRIYVPGIVAEQAGIFAFENRMQNYENHGFLEAWGIEDLLFEQSLWYDNLVFVLNDPMDLQDFAEAANEVLPEFWKATDLSSTFADMAGSMETIQWLASIILWVAVGATLVILSLLITLFLRDRKHEIGIYLALGEKKVKVIVQVLLEVVTIAVAAIGLALFSGGLLAGNLSETMLRRDLIAQQESSEVMGSSIIGMGISSDSLRWFSSGEMTTEQMLESFDLTIDSTTMMMFYGIGVVVIMISTVAPITYIMRLNPKKIMM